MNVSSMLVDSSRDLWVFFATFLCGQMAGLLLDFFRAMRKVFSFGKKGVALHDIVFCTATFLMFSYCVNSFNNGVLRWYEFAAVILGFVIYISAESACVMRLFVAVFKIIKRHLLNAKKLFLLAGKNIIKPAIWISSKIRAKKHGKTVKQKQ